MDKTITFKQIIEMWPSKRDLAGDVSRLTRKTLQPIAVNRWAARNSIPAKYDGVLVAAAAVRNISLSVVDLMNARSVHIDQVGNGPAFTQAPDTKQTVSEAAT